MVLAAERSEDHLDIKDIRNMGTLKGYTKVSIHSDISQATKIKWKRHSRLG